MKRSQLRSIITDAASLARCSEEESTRLIATVDNIERVAVGNYYISDPDIECGCPATNAGYYIPKGESAGEFSPEVTDNIRRFTSYFDENFQYDSFIEADRIPAIKVAKSSPDHTTYYVHYVPIEN